MTALKYIAASLFAVAAPAVSQTGKANGREAAEASDFDAQLEAQRQAQQQASESAERPGQVANSSNGQIGLRQSPVTVAPNLLVTGRIDSRIDNRVQNRIRNRIDRYYDPQANATSPFSVASEEARKKGRSTPR